MPFKMFLMQNEEDTLNGAANLQYGVAVRLSISMQGAEHSNILHQNMKKFNFQIYFDLFLASPDTPEVIVVSP